MHSAMSKPADSSNEDQHETEYRHLWGRRSGISDRRNDAMTPPGSSEVSDSQFLANERRKAADRRNSWRALPTDFENTRVVNDPKDRLIGELLREAKGWTEEQVQEVLAYQREHQLRFGVASIKLGLAHEKDVLHALARQFHYHYTPEGADSYNPELVVATDPFGEQAENFRELRSALIQGALEPDEDGRSPALAVVSADIGDGKSFVASNLAVAFSQMGKRTVLIDADMRTPRQHTVFGVDGKTGLSNVLAGRTKHQVVHRVASMPSLYIMPVGAVPPNPLELVQGAAFPLLIREMCSKFDHVIVDTPAIAHGADGRVVALACGAALAIGRKGKTSTPQLNSLVKRLSKGDMRMAGVILNEW